MRGPFNFKLSTFNFILPALLCCVTACQDTKEEQKRLKTPWGEDLHIGFADTAKTVKGFNISEIANCGEIIMLTEGGPTTYYEYRGVHLGAQFLLLEEFARNLGVRVRVEVCADSAEMFRRLKDCEGDVIAFDSVGQFKAYDKALQDSIRRWCTKELIEQVEVAERNILAGTAVKRKVYAPYLNLRGGVISKYDEFFKKYAKQAGWDWRLVAAQCYQESAFDPLAVSFAGAKGLMQIMPATAASLGLEPEEVYDPEKCIAAACKYLRDLTAAFSDVRDAYERQNFVLASYNGGMGHVRDAMALAEEDGADKYYWDEVKPYILLLATPEGYRNPIVKHGYLRGTETAGYVDAIRRRYSQYGGKIHAIRRSYAKPKPENNNISDFAPTAVPQRADSVKGNNVSR